MKKVTRKFFGATRDITTFLVNAARKTIGRFHDGADDKQSIKGRDLVLSLDSTTQATAERVMHGRSGAIVAIEPSSGEVLALSSSPDYLLSKFSDATLLSI